MSDAAAAEMMSNATCAEAMSDAAAAEMMSNATCAEMMSDARAAEAKPDAPAAEAMCYVSDTGAISNVSAAEVTSNAVAADDGAMPDETENDHSGVSPSITTTASAEEVTASILDGMVRKFDSPVVQIVPKQPNDTNQMGLSTIPRNDTDKMGVSTIPRNDTNKMGKSTILQGRADQTRVHNIRREGESDEVLRVTTNNTKLITEVKKWLMSSTTEDIDINISGAMDKLNVQDKNIQMLKNYNRLLKYILGQKTPESWYFLRSVLKMTEVSRQKHALRKIVDNFCFAPKPPKRLVIEYYNRDIPDGFVFCFNKKHNSEVFYKYSQSDTRKLQEKGKSVWIRVKIQGNIDPSLRTYSMNTSTNDDLWDALKRGMKNSKISENIYLHHTSMETGCVPYCSLQSKKVETPPTNEEYRQTLQRIIKNTTDKKTQKEMDDYFYVSQTPEERAKKTSLHNGQMKLRETHLRFVHEVLEHRLEEYSKQLSKDKLKISYAEFRHFASNLLLIYVGAANSRRPTGEVWTLYTLDSPLDEELEIKDQKFRTALETINPEHTDQAELRLVHQQIKIHKTITIQHGSWVKVHGKKYIVKSEQTDRYLPDLLRIWPGHALLIDPAAIDEEQLRLDLDLAPEDPCLKVEQKSFDVSEARQLSETCHAAGIRWKRVSENDIRNTESVNINEKYKTLKEYISTQAVKANTIIITATMQAKIFGPKGPNPGEWIKSTFSEFWYEYTPILGTGQPRWTLHEDSSTCDRTKQYQDQRSCDRFMCTVALKMGVIRLEKSKYDADCSAEVKRGTNMHFELGKDGFWTACDIIPVFVSDAREDTVLNDGTPSSALTSVLARINSNGGPKKNANLVRKGLHAYIQKAVFNVEEKVNSYVRNTIWLLIMAGFFHGENKALCYGHIKTSLLTFAEISKTMPLLFNDHREGEKFMRDLVENGMVSEFLEGIMEGSYARPGCMEQRNRLLLGTTMRPKPLEKEYIEPYTIITGKTRFFNHLHRVVGDNMEVEFHKFSSGTPPKYMFDASNRFDYEKTQNDINEDKETLQIKVPEGLYVPRSDFAGGKPMFYITVKIGKRSVYYIPYAKIVTFEQISAVELREATDNRRMVNTDDEILNLNNLKGAMNSDWANQRIANHINPWLPKCPKDRTVYHFSSQAQEGLNCAVHDSLAGNLILLTVQAMTYVHRQTPTLKQSNDDIETNAKFDKLLKECVMSPTHNLPKKFGTILEGKYTRKTHPAPNLKEALRDASHQFFIQQKSPIMWRDRLVGPFWLLGYMTTHGLSKILRWVHYHNILNIGTSRNVMEEELDKIDLKEIDPQAIAAIHQTLCYTMVQDTVVRALVSKLEEKFPVPNSFSFTHIRDAALAANLAPDNYRLYIRNSGYNQNSMNFLRFVERHLAIRWFNVITLASRPESGGNGTWSTTKMQDKIIAGALVRHDTTSPQTDDPTFLFTQNFVFDWPKGKNPVIRRIIELDLDNVLNVILNSNVFQRSEQQISADMDHKRHRGKDDLQQPPQPLVRSIWKSIMDFNAYRCFQEFASWLNNHTWNWRQKITLEDSRKQKMPRDATDGGVVQYNAQQQWLANLCSDRTLTPSLYYVPSNIENEEEYRKAIEKMTTRTKIMPPKMATPSEPDDDGFIQVKRR